MQSFIKGLFEGKETETLAQVTHLQLFDFLFIQRCTQLWAAPLSKQSLSLSREEPADTFGVPQPVLTEEKAPSTLCRRTPPKPSQRSCQRRQ